MPTMINGYLEVNDARESSDWNLLELWMLTICQNWPAASAGQNWESWALPNCSFFRAGVVWSVRRRTDALDLRNGWPGWQNGNHPWLWAHRFRMLIKKKHTHTHTHGQIIQNHFLAPKRTVFYENWVRRVPSSPVECEIGYSHLIFQRALFRFEYKNEMSQAEFFVPIYRVCE